MMTSNMYIDIKMLSVVSSLLVALCCSKLICPY